MADLLSLKVTQASLNQTALDWSQNMANHYAAIDAAVAAGSDVVLIPELSLTGYEVGDDFQRMDNERIHEALKSIAAYANAKDPNLLVSVGNPWRVQFREVFEHAVEDHEANIYTADNVKNAFYGRTHLPFNVQTSISGGKILGMTAKANLFNDERGYEKRHFEEWSFRDAAQVATLLNKEAESKGEDPIDFSYGTLPIKLPDGEKIPFGRPIIYVTDKNGNNYFHATGICEEKWTATKFDTLSDNTRYERDNILPSISRYLGTTAGVFLEIANASPPANFKQGKHIHLNDMASQHADVVVDTDGSGTSGASFAQDGIRLISQDGKTISAGERLRFDQVNTTTSVVQFNKASEHLADKAHVHLVREFKNLAAEMDVTIAWEDPDGPAAWDHPENPDLDSEQTLRSLALWKYDYMRKSGSKGRANALSGGQDSGFNVTTDYIQVCLGMSQLGVEAYVDSMNVPYKDKVMGAYEEGGEKAAIKEFMNNYLVVYYMPTDNSSDDTLNAARMLIEGGVDENDKKFEGIGGKFVVRNVQDLVTMCALTFGVENTSDMSSKDKFQLMEALSKFVHASPHDYDSEQMEAWAEDLQEKFPMLEDLTSAALPGHEIGYENFQARVRSVLIWAAANVHKKQPEANPNLDEAYGAYATSAGDLHGGATNSNAGIHKDDEQKYLRYLEEKGLQGVIEPIAALKLINGNKPSAELQPKKDGKVDQFDEEALQGTFPQKKALAKARHHTKIITDGGARIMNAGEVFDELRKQEEFEGLDNNELFNAVTYFYHRWETAAQHKIHFSAIAPLMGENVDHQTSLRTPNLSGRSLDEICKLGIDVMFHWAREEGLGWTDAQHKALSMRAWNADKDFVQEFYSKLWNKNKNENNPNMSFNLRGLYEDVKENGWSGEFKPLPQSHPIKYALAV